MVVRTRAKAPDGSSTTTSTPKRSPPSARSSLPTSITKRPPAATRSATRGARSSGATSSARAVAPARPSSTMAASQDARDLLEQHAERFGRPQPGGDHGDQGQAEQQCPAKAARWRWLAKGGGTEADA